MATARARRAQIDPITLVDLAPDDAAVLQAGDAAEARSYSRLDLTGRDFATLTDVVLSDCIIDELDLAGAQVQLLELVNCHIGTLAVGCATLKDVDLRSSDFGAVHGLEGLRGAIIDDAQLSLLAPLLAAHLGIFVD